LINSKERNMSNSSSKGTALIMSAEDLVDAALAGIDRGEEITLPSVEDATRWDSYDYDAAREELFAASRNGTPASRYSAGLLDPKLEELAATARS
jgi:uncharacterized protein